MTRAQQIIEGRYWHGTSANQAKQIIDRGFEDGHGGIWPGASVQGIVFITPSRNGAKWYANSPRTKALGGPGLVEVAFEGKVEPMPREATDIYKALDHLGQRFRIPYKGPGSILDVDAIKAACLSNGIQAFSYRDRWSNGRTAVAVIDRAALRPVRSAVPRTAS